MKNANFIIRQTVGVIVFIHTQQYNFFVVVFNIQYILFFLVVRLLKLTLVVPKSCQAKPATNQPTRLLPNSIIIITCVCWMKLFPKQHNFRFLQLKYTNIHVVFFVVACKNNKTLSRCLNGNQIFIICCCWFFAFVNIS